MSAEYMQYVRLYAVSVSAPFELLQQTTIRLFNRLHGQQNSTKMSALRRTMKPIR